MVLFGVFVLRFLAFAVSVPADSSPGEQGSANLESLEIDSFKHH